jgi:hypothetical protein
MVGWWYNRDSEKREKSSNSESTGKILVLYQSVAVQIGVKEQLTTDEVGSRQGPGMDR